jgi:fructokinase
MRLFSIGEALIDFLPYEEKGFVPVTGGAPANVAACAAKLGSESYFLGKVGEDMFGDKIIAELKEAGVNTSYLTKTSRANTALSFVTLKENGEREFAFTVNLLQICILNQTILRTLIFNKATSCISVRWILSICRSNALPKRL